VDLQSAKGAASSAGHCSWVRLRMASSDISDTPAAASAQLVYGVSFAEWTSDRQMPRTTFLGLRPDKSPQEVVPERV
jgi:hypothetical protein